MSKELSFNDYTQAFYEDITYDPKEVFQGLNYNRIKTMSIVVWGNSGSGKTTLAKNILQYIKNYYGEDKVNCVYTNNVSLKTLMYIATNKCPNRNKPIQVLIFDDATAVKLNPKEVKEFFSLRHVYEERTSMKEGVIYSILLTHEWFSLDRIFRRYVNRAIALTVPVLDEYALRHAKRMFTNEGINFLIDNWRLAEHYDTYKGTGLVRLPFIPKDNNSFIGKILFKQLDSSYWNIKEDSTLQQDIEYVIDSENLTIKYHTPVKEKDAIAMLENKRKQDAIRQARYRAKLKNASRYVINT